MRNKTIWLGVVIGLLLAATGIVLTASADTSLVVHLLLDETADATTFADASGQSNTGTCTVGVCPTAGVISRLGQAAQFDGSNDVITIADAPSLRNASFTVSVWFQWAGTGTANINFLTAKGLENMELHTGVGVNGLRFIPAGYPATSVDALNVIVPGWNHVAATYDGSAAYLYVNGGLVGSHTGITGGNNLTIDSAPFSVGRRSDATYPFAGMIDEVRVYSRVLSAGEIATLAGGLDAPGAPTTTAGHMPTLQEVYRYLTTGTEPGAAQAFQEPATGPTATMKTLQQIYVALKTQFDQITVGAADVRSGQKYFSLAPWGIQTGTLPDNGAINFTPGTAAQTIPAGYHNGSGTVAGDANLVTGNIKQGVTLFGVSGKTEVVDTTTATPATATDIVAGKTAFVNGVLVTGTNHVAQYICATGWSGTHCDACASGWIGVNCDTRIYFLVNQTGQTQCWNTAGTLIGCAGTGQDGEYQKGIAPAIAPEAYSPPIWTGPRFIDRGDGTVEDTATTLIWLKNAGCFVTRTWQEALNAANGLQSGACGLTDGSSAGQWRLPNANEQRSLVDGTQSAPTLPPGHPFINVALTYWTGTTLASDVANAYVIYFLDGSLVTAPKMLAIGYAWPVRDGQ